MRILIFLLGLFLSGYFFGPSGVIIYIGAVVWAVMTSKTKERKLKKSAGEGDPKAQFDIGLWYLEAFIFRPKPAEAMLWLEKAFKQGYAEAGSKLRTAFIMKEKGVSLKEAERRADMEETNERFKEAAEKGADPQTVAGFNCMEKIDKLKDGSVYQAIKGICMELAKSGYRLEGSVSTQKPMAGRNGYTATVHVYDGDARLGYIELREFQLDSYFFNSHQEEQYRNECRGKGKCLNYRIQDDRAGIYIYSTKAAPPEAPPEWLMICANILAPVSDPEWVKEYPEAKQYVNTMFKF